MPNFEYRRGLEDVRELCSLRRSVALGRKVFHDGEILRLPNGKKRANHVIDSHVADRLAAAFEEVIDRIDLHLPKAQLTIVTPAEAKQAEATAEQYGDLPPKETENEE